MARRKPGPPHRFVEPFTSRREAVQMSAPVFPPESLGLPSPTDLPEADVLIFDGHCSFCRRQVARIGRADAGGKRLAFVSLHDPIVGQRWPELSHQQLMDEMTIVSHNGRVRGGAAAIQYLTRRLPRWWILAPVLHFPGAMYIVSRIYRQIAKHRYRWGRYESCDEGNCSIIDRSRVHK